MYSTTDWDNWPADYRDPSSLLSQRLEVVQRCIDDLLDATAPRPVIALS